MREEESTEKTEEVDVADTGATCSNFPLCMVRRQGWTSRPVIQHRILEEDRGTDSAEYH